jgi:hypothetical protein
MRVPMSVPVESFAVTAHTDEAAEFDVTSPIHIVSSNPATVVSASSCVQVMNPPLDTT